MECVIRSGTCCGNTREEERAPDFWYPDIAGVAQIIVGQCEQSVARVEQLWPLSTPAWQQPPVPFPGDIPDFGPIVTGVGVGCGVRP